MTRVVCDKDSLITALSRELAKAEIMIGKLNFDEVDRKLADYVQENDVPVKFLKVAEG